MNNTYNVKSYGEFKESNYAKNSEFAIKVEDDFEDVLEYINCLDEHISNIDDVIYYLEERYNSTTITISLIKL